MLITEPYLRQRSTWPQSGNHIMAQYDADSVIVYQAYAPAIGHFAVENGYLGGSEYSLNRMSWIKPNFLWMMHRSGWGTKHGQEVILAIKIKRSGFESILEQAVHSSFIPDIYGTITAWKDALANSQVRLQWDPDYDPLDNRLERRAMQLGLSGEILAQYAQGGWIIGIEDVTPLTHAQRGNAKADRLEQLVLPKEAVYPVIHPELARKLQLSPISE